MSYQNILDLLYDMCRLCLERVGCHNLFTEIDYTDDIAECAGIHINPDAELPQSICEVCVERLRMCKAFRSLVAQSNKRLIMLKDGEDLRQNESESECEFVVPEVVMKSPERPTTAAETTSHSTRNTREQENLPNHRIRVRVDIFDDSEDKTATSKEKDKSKKNYTEQSVPERASRSTVSQFFAGGEGPPRRVKRGATGSLDEPKTKIRMKEEGKFKQPKTEVDLTCEVCSKVCNNSKALYLHRRIHVKSHVCPVCAKAFSAKNDLTKHVRIHTGERPFTCHICDKSFTQACTLKAHMDIHDKSPDIANIFKKTTLNKYRNTPGFKNEHITNDNMLSLQNSGAVSPNLSEYIFQKQNVYYSQYIFNNNSANSLQECINVNEAENQFNKNSDSSSETVMQLKEKNREFDDPIKVKIGISPRLKKKARRCKRKKIMEQNDEVSKVNTDVNENLKNKEHNSKRVEDSLNVDGMHSLLNMSENIIERDTNNRATECEVPAPKNDAVNIRDNVNTDLIDGSSNGLQEYSPNNHIQLWQNANIDDTSLLDEAICPNICKINYCVASFKTNTTKMSGLTEEISEIKDYPLFEKQGKMGRRKKIIKEKRDKVIGVVSDVNESFKDKERNCKRLEDSMKVDNINLHNRRKDVINGDNKRGAAEIVVATPKNTSVKAIDTVNADLIDRSSNLLIEYSSNNHTQLQNTNDTSNLEETTNPKRNELTDEIKENNNVKTMDVVDMKNESIYIQKEDYCNHNLKEDHFDEGVPSYIDDESLTECTAVNESDISTVNSEKPVRQRRIYTCNSCQITFKMRKYYKEHRSKHRRILRFC